MSTAIAPHRPRKAARKAAPKAQPLMTDTAMATGPARSALPQEGSMLHRVWQYVARHPDCISPQVATGLKITVVQAASSLSRLEDQGWVIACWVQRPTEGRGAQQLKQYREGTGIAPVGKPYRPPKGVHREPHHAPGIEIHDRPGQPTRDLARPAYHEAAAVEHIEAAPAPDTDGPENPWDRRHPTSSAEGHAPAGDQPESAPPNGTAKTSGSAASVSGPVPVAPSAPPAEGRAAESAPGPLAGEPGGPAGETSIDQFLRQIGEFPHLMGADARRDAPGIAAPPSAAIPAPASGPRASRLVGLPGDDTGDHIRFALFDDAELSIDLGEDVVRLPRKAVQRLHKFLNGFLEIAS